VAAGMGYSRDLPKRLKGEMEIMLGEKTRAQIEEELHPKMVEKSAEEKGARSHFNLGKTMIERGQPESAMREFNKAVELEPLMGKALIHLGCLQLDGGKLAEAMGMHVLELRQWLNEQNIPQNTSYEEKDIQTA